MYSPWVGVIRKYEKESGYELIDEAPWLNKKEWNTIVTSMDGTRVRLVLLDVIEPRTGALTRLLDGITKSGLTPVIVEPTWTLAEWCKRKGWRKRVIGKNVNRQEVWYPR